MATISREHVGNVNLDGSAIQYSVAGSYQVAQTGILLQSLSQIADPNLQDDARSALKERVKSWFRNTNVDLGVVVSSETPLGAEQQRVLGNLQAMQTLVDKSVARIKAGPVSKKIAQQYVSAFIDQIDLAQPSAEVLPGAWKAASTQVEASTYEAFKPAVRRAHERGARLIARHGQAVVAGSAPVAGG